MRYNRLEYLVKFKGYDESQEVHTQVHAAQRAISTRPSSTPSLSLERIW
jgi:hypothetical protein